MAYIDTHCHLDMILEKLKSQDLDTLLSSSFPPEFEGCITVCCHPHSIKATLDFIKHPKVWAAFGLHPHDASLYTDSLENQLRSCVLETKAVAWGEIGLDYHYEHSPKDVQQKVFARQLQVAQELGKALVIHTREAEEDTLRIMKDELNADWPVHVHCFTSSENLAENLISRFSRLYIGFTGVITFKNSEEIRNVVKALPISRIVLETDSPFMTPIPHRGKVCHPGHIPWIAECISQIKGLSLEEVYSKARLNTQDLYKI